MTAKRYNIRMGFQDSLNERMTEGSERERVRVREREQEWLKKYRLVS